MLRDALLLELRGINRTAAAIAVVQGDPGIMDKFRMPYGVNDTTLMAQAKSMGDVAGQMTTDFVAYGHAATFVADLQTHLGNFNSADVTQNVGQQAVGGTTAEFSPLIDSGLTKVKQLDAFMNNFYKSNAEKLGEWKTASHVERAPKKKDTPPP